MLLPAVCRGLSVLLLVPLRLLPATVLRLLSVLLLPVLTLLLAVTLLFTLVSLSLGFTMSTLVSSQVQAMQASMFYLMPSILLSGFAFPYRGMRARSSRGSDRPVACW